jgi:hypothetical protein
MSMNQLRKPAGERSAMHPDLRLIEQAMQTHEQEDDRRFLETAKVFDKFEGAVWTKFDSLEAKFDKFDNKLWAIVVMVALGVLVALVKEFINT